MPSNDVVLCRASDSAARTAAGVWLRSFAAALPTVRCAHDEAEIHDRFGRVLVARYETWVADSRSSTVGLLVLDG
ncbi:hypothetical protein ACFRUQ_23170 [Streptomyces goshikiensis]|uniref:hypothetical protein n=1 Tax=Streptomyces goshikiensis TaxID=1942 RepID=UPI002698F7AF